MTSSATIKGQAGDATECFAFSFGRDVLHEWDTAMTLADYLAAPV